MKTKNNLQSVKKTPVRKRNSLLRLKNATSVLSHTHTNSSNSKGVKVILRIRPNTEKELASRQRDIIETVDKNIVIYDPKEVDEFNFHQGKKIINRDITKRVARNLQFSFDSVYSQEDTTGDLYRESIQPIVTSLLNGYNCTVFAYGATGAGKTYTMLGTPEKPGVTQLLMQDLFQKIKEIEGVHVDVLVSYLEIYNENVYDLFLQQRSGSLKLHEASDTVEVHDLKWLTPNSVEELMDLLRAGNSRRTQHPTDANAESSRSHAVFQVIIRSKEKFTYMAPLKCGKLQLIDLAGSERASATTNMDMRKTEGANINVSLLALGNCINALAEGASYIPFRNSKLTRLLKGSLGGNCQTLMIANVSPSSLTDFDTYNTLKYASRAKKIKNKVRKNAKTIEFTPAEFRTKITEANTEITKLREEKKDLQSILEKEKKKIEEYERKLSEMENRCKLMSYMENGLQEMFSHVNRETQTKIYENNIELQGYLQLKDEENENNLKEKLNETFETKLERKELNVTFEGADIITENRNASLAEVVDHGERTKNDEKHLEEVKTHMGQIVSVLHELVKTCKRYHGIKAEIQNAELEYTPQLYKQEKLRILQDWQESTSNIQMKVKSLKVTLEDKSEKLKNSLEENKLCAIKNKTELKDLLNQFYDGEHFNESEIHIIRTFMNYINEYIDLIGNEYGPFEYIFGKLKNELACEHNLCEIICQLLKDCYIGLKAKQICPPQIEKNFNNLISRIKDKNFRINCNGIENTNVENLEATIIIEPKENDLNKTFNIASPPQLNETNEQGLNSTFVLPSKPRPSASLSVNRLKKRPLYRPPGTEWNSSLKQNKKRFKHVGFSD